MLLLLSKSKDIRREMNVFDEGGEINILPAFIHNVYFKDGGSKEFAVCEDRSGCLYKVETKSVFDTLAIKVKEVDDMFDREINRFQVVEIDNKEAMKLHTKPVIEDILVSKPEDANRMKCRFNHVSIKRLQQDELLEDLKFLYDNAKCRSCNGRLVADGGYQGSFSTIENLIHILDRTECTDISIEDMSFYFTNGCGKNLFRKIDDMGKKYDMVKFDQFYYRKTKALLLNRKEPSLTEQVVARLNKSRR